jgi:hypothetical protein
MDLKTKPRVFLSHSKKDSSFIKRIENDLRCCQIDPWLDEYEIRHGKPWLEEIFSLGIPTCHSVFIYLSENSIESQIVKKEIDSALIRLLSEKHIGFLPYVSDDTIRAKIRLDLQTIQSPIFNDGNYVVVFPQFVSAIWQNFLEYQINNAVRDEKNIRLEMQLKIQELNQSLSTSVFSPSEESDFSFIYKSMNKYYEIIDEKRSIYTIKINLISFINQLKDYNIKWLPFINSIISKDELLRLKIPEGRRMTIANIDLIEMFTTYGLITKVRNPHTTGSGQFSNIIYYDDYIFTEKLYRFRYWLEFREKTIEPLFT